MSEPSEPVSLVDALSSGIPLIEYEHAFGWNNWDSPIHNSLCTKCKADIPSTPTPVERHAHSLQCEEYRNWRTERWLNFNNSLIGKLLAIQFKAHWFNYYTLDVSQESTNAAVGKLLGNFVSIKDSSSS